MFTTSQFLDRKYDSKKYTCLHFVTEVWAALTGENFYERLKAILEIPEIHRKAVAPQKFGFKRLMKPVNPCIAFMRSVTGDLHAAIYLDGKIFQIQSFGVEFMPLGIAMRGFSSIRYYR